MSRARWCQAGAVAFVVYLGLCAAAHAVALAHVRQFAAARKLQVEHIGALPLPPSLANWDGLIRTPSGVYEARMDLFSREPANFRFLADAAPNRYIETARHLPKVQLYLRFARFPVYHFAAQGSLHIVEIGDLRFFQRGGRRTPFTFRVVFDADGRVLEQSLAED